MKHTKIYTNVYDWTVIVYMEENMVIGNCIVFQDFGIDSIQNLASAFDRIFHKIVDPIKEAIDLISDLIDMGRNHILEKMIVDLVALFKELPSLIKEMAENLYHSMLKLNSFDGYPLVDRVKKLINRIRVFIDDVKADIFGFYHVSIIQFMNYLMSFYQIIPNYLNDKREQMICFKLNEFGIKSFVFLS